MTLQLCQPPDSNSLDHDATPLPLSTTRRSPSNPTISVLCYLLLIGCCKGKCFTANRTLTSTCTLCFEEGGDFSNCTITNKPDFTEALCRSTCCTIKYSSALPSTCYAGLPGVQNSEAVTLGTVLVIIFFAVPVLICIIAFIHSCVTRR